MTVTYNGAPDGLLTYTSPSAKLCLGPSGTYRYGPHNLYVNSASPANQSITVVSGAAYTVVITGSVSVTASGAATGTWTAGTTNFTAATGTLTLGSTSGSGTVHVRRTNSDTTYLATGASARYGLPYEWDSSGVLQGILVEEARTNLCLRNRDLSNAAWTATRLSVSQDGTLGPDGSQAWKLTEDSTASSTHTLAQNVTVVGATTYTSSFILKAGSRTWARIIEGSTVTASAWFNLATGTIGTVTGTGSPSASITSLGGGWYRCGITFTTAGTSANAQLQMANADGSNSYNGTGTDSIYVCLPQLERGAWATSPIETFGSTVTRAIDLPSLATTATPFNAAQGTIFVEANAKVDQGSTTITHFGISTTPGSTSTEIILGSFSLSFGLFNVNNSGNQASLEMPAMTVGTTFKQAAAYAANDFACSGQGSAVQTDNSGSIPSALTTFQIGYRSNEVAAFNGYIRKVMYLPRRMSNAELQALTT